MISITTSLQHSSPGAVTKRLDTWSALQKNDNVIKTVEAKLDELYQIIYKVAPVRTGYMRSTLKVSRNGDTAAQIAVTAYYARFVERGTENMGAQPFFMNNAVKMSVEIIIAVRQLFMTVK